MWYGEGRSGGVTYKLKQANERCGYNNISNGDTVAHQVGASG